MLAPALSVFLFSLAALGSIEPAQAQSDGQSSGPSSAPYCLAVRGNGEAAPAHWGALAAVVERLGLPQAQAGGSSASINLFLLENIARNAGVAHAPNAAAQRSRAALLLKSLHGFANYLASRPQAQTGLGFLRAVGQARRLDQAGQLDALKRLVEAATPAAVGAAAQQAGELLAALQSIGVGQTPRYLELQRLAARAQAGEALGARDLARLRFYAEETRRALAAASHFDAESDVDLLFRDGFIDFPTLARAIGGAARFYAEPADSASFERFVSACEGRHAGLTWQELAIAAPACAPALEAALTAHFARVAADAPNPVDLPVGAVIPTFAVTGVLQGATAAEARRVYAAYHERLDRSAAAGFGSRGADDLKIGYWAPQAWLDAASRALQAPGLDEKSARYLPLGEAPWSTALRYSPAEPGLAPLLPMTVGGRDVLSAGGWADLYPVQVLKAAGCENVVYVTRRGGESLFAQGVAKRLMGFDRPWERFRTTDPTLREANERLNDGGDPSDISSLWARLFNLALPTSSLSMALARADAVVCTDWNRFDAKTEMPTLVQDGYHAPFIARDAAGAIGRALALQNAAVLRAQDAQGPRFDGCRPR